jgi:hypothetical protein
LKATDGKKKAIKVQENLEKINENEQPVKWNTDKGFPYNSP